MKQGGVTVQRRRMARSTIMVLAFCAFIVLLAGGLYAADKLLPSPDLLASDVVLPEPIVAEEPALPVFYADLEYHSEMEPPCAVEPSDAIEPLFREYTEEILTSRPVRMRIPALSLDYIVQGTGADESGTMQIVPALAVISWFELSSIPGNRGNAIFGGHNSWGGVRSRIFTLDGMEIGDELIIEYADGTSLRFLMESVFVYELKTAPAHLIMNVLGEARVTLITCKGPFNTTIGTSDNRIVAVFKEEGVFEVPDPPIEKFPPRVVA